MMGDVGDAFNAWKKQKKLVRDTYGVDCPMCVALLPKACPSILLPQQMCKIHKYRDPRPALTNEQKGYEND